MQHQGMDPMVILTQMVYKMKTEREVDQRCYEAEQGRHKADQRGHEEWMQFEANERAKEARQRKAQF
jgi:hypothetical protein